MKVNFSQIAGWLFSLILLFVSLTVPVGKDNSKANSQGVIKLQLPKKAS